MMEIREISLLKVQKIYILESIMIYPLVFAINVCFCVIFAKMEIFANTCKICIFCNSLKNVSFELTIAGNFVLL